jgi:phosphatidylethanolamine/phosphatidyl-N-methylethanolamine N-methyltransferase
MLTFLGQALRNFHHVGSVWPSSPWLAKALVRPMREASTPRRILEVGAGTGAVTRSILEAMGPEDTLDIVEINPTFCESLERLAAARRAEIPKATIRVHACPIEETPLQGPYDFVICGLPFNNFPPSLMRSIFRRMLSMLAEGGTLTYFEYAGVRVMRSGVTGQETRRRLRRISAVGKLLRRRLSGRRELILGNFPPAMAIRLKRNGTLPRKFIDRDTISIETMPAETPGRTADSLVSSGS